jgi:hypothetical protein
MGSLTLFALSIESQSYIGRLIENGRVVVYPYIISQNQVEHLLIFNMNNGEYIRRQILELKELHIGYVVREP